VCTINSIEIQLIRIEDGKFVTAQLILLAARHIEDFSTFWRERIETSADADRYWDWERKKQVYLSQGGKMHEGYAIEYDALTQGLMILKTRGERSRVDPTRKLVYIHYVATAPWNRPNSLEKNGFRAVGFSLLQFARVRSEELGYGGLVGLHSLPSADEFHRKIGMIDGGMDAEKESLRYFEWYYYLPSAMEE
jgi:hypothetical protein